MAANGIIRGKLQLLDEILGNLRSLGGLTSEQLDADWRIKMTVERALQVLVEIVIDISHRLIAESGQTPASSGRDAIERCVQMGALSSTEPYQRMVQFRNFVVHMYERIETVFLVDILRNRLGDFERFRDEVLAYAEKSNTDE
ncbi:MAG: DUF86 domain-containing protein [Chloroflexi bacterium]|nr:DUF86 domain-containing protein [Chloroflexota bacterium]